MGDRGLEHGWSLKGADALPTGAFLARLQRQGRQAADSEDDERFTPPSHGRQSSLPPVPPDRPRPGPRHSHTASTSSLGSVGDDGDEEDSLQDEAAQWDYLEVTADGGVAVRMRLDRQSPTSVHMLDKAASSPAELLPPPPDGAAPGEEGGLPTPPAYDVMPINIVMLVAGTRGDVQPFIAIGLKLQQEWGHRVRLATHAVYRPFVEGAGLEFYPLGGDPVVLSEFVVKHRGVLPNLAPEMMKEVARQRREVAAIVASTWGACCQPDPGSPGAAPFRADCVYANPPVFSHLACAEALGVPCHVAFTMPWTPTTAFPSPLIRILHRNQLPAGDASASITAASGQGLRSGGASSVPGGSPALSRTVSATQPLPTLAGGGGAPAWPGLPPSGLEATPPAGGMRQTRSLRGHATPPAGGSGSAWGLGGAPGSGTWQGQGMQALPPEVEAMLAAGPGGSRRASRGGISSVVSPVDEEEAAQAAGPGPGSAQAAAAPAPDAPPGLGAAGRIRALLALRPPHQRGISYDSAYERPLVSPLPEAALRPRSGAAQRRVSAPHWQGEQGAAGASPRGPGGRDPLKPMSLHRRSSSLPVQLAAEEERRALGAGQAVTAAAGMLRRLSWRRNSLSNALSSPSFAAPSRPSMALHARMTGAANWYSYFAAADMTSLVYKKPLGELAAGPLGLGRGHASVQPRAMITGATPITYLWSPSLVPKPPDWGPNVSVVGFSFLPEAVSGASYAPPPALAAFLAAGPPPVFIGFGSLVVGDPGRLTHRIFKAVRLAGVRALLQRGWGGLGTGCDEEPPPGVLVIDAVPHEWLFPRCAAVIHHGGAGTTATGLRHGRPTLVVPFFCDQPFWGQSVARAGAGPKPLPIDRLNSRRLVVAIRELLQPEVAAGAARIAEQLALEDGAAGAVAALHAHLARAGVFARKRRESWRQVSAAVGAVVSRSNSPLPHLATGTGAAAGEAVLASHAARPPSSTGSLATTTSTAVSRVQSAAALAPAGGSLGSSAADMAALAAGSAAARGASPFASAGSQAAGAAAHVQQEQGVAAGGQSSKARRSGRNQKKCSIM